MFKTKIEIFEGSSVDSVKQKANKYREKHNAEIVSADLVYVPGSVVASNAVYLTVVFKFKEKY